MCSQSKSLTVFKVVFRTVWLQSDAIIWKYAVHFFSRAVWIYNKVSWKYTFNQRIASEGTNERTNDRMNNRKHGLSIPSEKKLFILAYSSKVFCTKSYTNFNADEGKHMHLSQKRERPSEKEEYQNCLRICFAWFFTWFDMIHACIWKVFCIIFYSSPTLHLD